MAITNRDRISRALDHLRDGLTPFVENELQLRLESDWQTRVNQSRKFAIPSLENGAFAWDSLSLLRTMFNFWNDVFKFSLSHLERSFVSELMTIRNEFAHEKQFSSDDAYRALDTAGRLLVAVAAPTEAKAIDAMRQELLRNVYAESWAHIEPRHKTQPIGDQTGNGLDSQIVAPARRAEYDGELDSEFDTHQPVDDDEAVLGDVAAHFGAAEAPPLAESDSTSIRGRRSSKRARQNRAFPVLAMIAALAIGLVGGLAWQKGAVPTGASSVEQSLAIEDHLLRELADYYLIFAEDDSRVVELGPERKDLIESWMGKRLGRRLQVADLSRHGSQFKGGRLIPVEGNATALFVYQADGGELFSVAITQSWSKGERTRNAVRKSGLDMVFWSRAGLAYVVMGPLDPSLLDSIAKDLEKHFDEI